MKISSRSLSVFYPPGTSPASEVHAAEIPGSLPLSSTLKVVTKNRKDLSAISVVPQSAAVAGAALKWQGLTSYVRLYLDISSMGRLAGCNYAVACQIALSLLPTAGTLQLDWIALLHRKEDGTFLFHRMIEEKVSVAAGEAPRSWDVRLTSRKIQEAGSLFIAVQCSAMDADFTVERFGVRVQALETQRAAFTTWVGGLVEGWVRSDEASLWLPAPAGGPDPEAGLPISFGRFVGKAPQGTSAGQGGCAAYITSGDELIAYLDLTSPPAGLCPPDPAPSTASKDTVPPDVAGWLYERGKTDLLWMLGDRIHGARLSEAAEHAFALYGAKALLDTNAVESAYQGLQQATGDNAHFQAMSAPVQRTMRLSLAKACVRSGRPREAEQILRDMVAVDPLDWEYYFQLAIIAMGGGFASRGTYLRIVEGLNQKLPNAALVLVIEDLIARGCVDEAWIRVLCELKLRDDRRRDLWLTLGNVHLARSDLPGWKASVGRMFSEMELSEPQFDVARDPSEDAFHRLEMAGLRPEPAEVQNDLISVVMTTYNAEHTVKRAVRSVLSQTYRNIRLIIVDDCSTDDTLGLLRYLQTRDSRIEILQTPSNVGTYCAKNMALQRFDSDYFTFHDSDDWMHPERLATHHRLMRKTPHLLCTTSRWYRMDTRGMAIPRQGGGYLHDNPASTFFHRSVIDRIGYFDSVRVGADTEFAARIRRCFGAASMQGIAKPLAIGLHHSASLTRSGTTAFDEYRYSAVRSAYWESWTAWQRRTACGGGGAENFYVPFPHYIRSFPAPAGIVPERIADLEAASRSRVVERLPAVT